MFGILTFLGCSMHSADFDVPSIGHDALAGVATLAPAGLQPTGGYVGQDLCQARNSDPS